MKPVDVKSSTYIDFNVDKNKKESEFEVGDYVRTSKYKNIFEKSYVSNWSEEVFAIKEVKKTVPWTYVIEVLNEEEIIRTFYEKELQKTNQTEVRVEKVIKRKTDKWKDYDNWFNSQTNKKHITSISEYFPKPCGHSGKNIKVKLKHLIMRQKHI